MSKRPFSSYLIAVISLLLAALAASQPILFGIGDVVETLLWLGLVLSVIWLGYVIPSVEIKGSELVLVNPFRVARIGLGAIEEVDTRFALKVSGAFGSISAWAAPAPGRLSHRRHSREDYKPLGLKDGQSVRPGDLPSTISGSLALQINRAQRQNQSLPEHAFIGINWLGIALVLLPTILLFIHYWA